MGPILAESAPKRFAWLLALCVATAVAFAMTRPEPPRQRTHDPYKQFKRVGHCKDGRWVQTPAQTHH